MPRPVRVRPAPIHPPSPRARPRRSLPGGAASPSRAIRCASCGSSVHASLSSFRRPWLIHVLPLEAAGTDEPFVRQFVLHTDCRDLFPSMAALDAFLRKSLRAEGGQATP